MVILNGSTITQTPKRAFLRVNTALAWPDSRKKQPSLSPDSRKKQPSLSRRGDILRNLHTTLDAPNRLILYRAAS